jgi:hypothetical protein
MKIGLQKSLILLPVQMHRGNFPVTHFVTKLSHYAERMYVKNKRNK